MALVISVGRIKASEVIHQLNPVGDSVEFGLDVGLSDCRAYTLTTSCIASQVGLINYDISI